MVTTKRLWAAESDKLKSSLTPQFTTKLILYMFFVWFEI